MGYGDLLVTLDAARYPFLVRRLTMSTVDPKFAAMPTPAQENVLWGMEKSIAAKQNRKPTPFLIWDSDLKQYCDQVALDGRTYEVIVFYPLLLAVSFSSDSSVGTVYVYVRNADDSKIRMNLFPQQFRMTHIHPKLVIEPPLPPEKIAGKIRSRARWSATFARIAGAMQTRQVTTQSYTVANGYESGRFDIRNQWTGQEWQGNYAGRSSGTASTTTTTTTPDYEARARAEAQAQAIEANAAARGANVVGASLRAQTIMPGGEVFGAVYFQRDKKGKYSILSIPIGTYQFEFGVQWK